MKAGNIEENEESYLKRSISSINSTGKYQIAVISLMCFVWVLITFSGMINSYVFMNPIFQCNGKIKPQIEACEMMKKCRVLNDFTATSQIQIYCEQKNFRSAIQSFYPIGCLFGLLSISILSDLKGRKFTFLLSSFSGFTGPLLILLGGYCRNYYIIIVGQVFAGIAGSSLPIITYTITGQICSPQLRQRSIMIYCAFWGLTQMSFLLIYRNIKEWEHYLLLTNIFPSIFIFLVGFFWLKESPSFWLLNERNGEKCKETIKYIGQFNGKNSQQIQRALEEISKAMILENKSKKLSVEEGFKKLMSNSKYYKLIICITFAQIGFCAFYYGVLSSLEKIGHNFGINVFIIGLHEFIGYSIASYVVPGMKRKSGLILVNLFTSLIGLTYLFQFVVQNPTFQLITLSLSTIGFVFNYSLVSMINTESFPNEVQSTAMGLSSGLSQIGRFAIPFIITYLNDIKVHPFVGVSSILLIFGVFPIFFIPETLKKLEQKQKKE